MNAFDTAPAWLENSIIEGLQMLLTLRLRNAPAADTVDAVVDVWVALFVARRIGWDEARDVRRLHRAFAVVGGTVDAWPAPAQVINALPALPELPQLTFTEQCSLPKAKTQEKVAQLQAQLKRWAVKMPRAMSHQEMHQRVQNKLKEKT